MSADPFGDDLGDNGADPDDLLTYGSIIDDPSMAELEADLAATQAALGIALDLERQQWDNLVEARQLVAAALARAQRASLRYRNLRANARPTR